MLAAFIRSDDADIVRRLGKLENCCCSAMLWQRPSGEIACLPTRCRDRLCPTCARRRSKITAARCQEACRRMDSIRLITLTAPAVDAPLAEQLRQLRKALGAFRRTRAWKTHVRGGFYVVEITRNPNTGLWHPHVHVLADGVYWAHASIRDGWRSALQGSAPAWKLSKTSPIIVDVRFVHDGRDAARYMAKYVSKASSIDEWPPHAIVEYALAMKGVRSIATFGTLHGQSLDPPDPNTDEPGSTELVPIGVLARAAAAGDGEAVFALRGVLTLDPQLRALVAWDPPPINRVDSLDRPTLLQRIGSWCASVWRRWPNIDHAAPRGPDPEGGADLASHN